MSEAREAVLKAVVCALALLAVITLERARDGWLASNRRRLMIALTVVGGLSYVNFGAFHTDGTPLHIWDQFHYFVGSKYFPEVGYDGLYLATIEARSEGVPDFVRPTWMRDLATGRVVRTDSQHARFREVRSRFDDTRWREFVGDASRVFLPDELFLDHGYNATPPHVAVSRLFSSSLPYRHRTMGLVGLLDFALLGLAAFAVHRAFGLETLACVSLAFGLGYCSRFYWVGGAFLRQDWLVALFLAASALKLQRHGWAGVALAYAVMVRVFPVLFLLPLLVYAASRPRSPSARAAITRFCVGFSLRVLGLAVAGCFAGRGAHAFVESAERLRVHASVLRPTCIGLRLPFVASLANLRGDLIDPAFIREYSRVAADYARLGHERAPLILVVTVAVLALAVRAARRAPDVSSAFVCGVAFVFALAPTECYYGSFFALLPLVLPLRSARVFLGATLFTYATLPILLPLIRFGYVKLNGAAVYVPVSALLALVLVVWLSAIQSGRIRSASPFKH